MKNNIDKIIVVDKINESYFRVVCPSEVKYKLKKYFEYFIPNYKHHPRVKSKQWNGKLSAYKLDTETLPVGLKKDLEYFAKESGYEIKYAYDEELDYNDVTDNDLETFYKSIFKDTGYYPRDYQHTAIKEAIRAKRGVTESATASGKSLNVYTLIRFLLSAVEGRIMLIVPSVGLTKQMFSDFIEFGWVDCINDVSVLYSNSDMYDPNRRILISTYQSLANKNDEFFAKYDAVLIDECHGLNQSSTTIKNIMDKCVNAYYRYGFTGTLPINEGDQINLYGSLAPVLTSVKSKELIDKGILSKIKIKNVYIKYSDDDVNKVKKMNYNEEVKWISSHPLRNKAISFIIKNINSTDNSLILCQHLEHFDSIYDHLVEEFPDRKIVKIRGDVGADEREKIRKDVEHEDGTIIVASYGTMSTGVSIKKIHHVFFASSYKSKIKVLQSIGRGLRKHDSKDFVTLWDLIDDLRWAIKKRDGSIGVGENYVFQQFKERLGYYKEQGFEYLKKNLNIYKL